MSLARQRYSLPQPTAARDIKKNVADLRMQYGKKSLLQQMQSDRKSPLYRHDLWLPAANDGYFLRKYFLVCKLRTSCKLLPYRNWTVHAEILRSGPNVEKKIENLKTCKIWLHWTWTLNQTLFNCINQNSRFNASRKRALLDASCETTRFPNSILYPPPAHHALNPIESIVFDFVRNNTSLSAKPMFAQICDIYLHAIL